MKTLAYRFLTCSLALLLAINTAAAGRWLRSCWDAPACGPMPVCEPVDCCPVETCCEPVVVECGGCDGCGEVEVVSDCGCSDETVSWPVMGGTHESAATPTEAVAPPQPTEVYEPAPATFGGGFRSDNATVEDAAPNDDWNAGFEEPAEPTPVEEPAEELFADPVPVEEPADDLFGDPAPAPAEPVAVEPADDLFAEEPVEEENDLFGEPAEEPMEEEDALFGAPAEEPADDLFGAPAEEPADDLFDEPAAEEPMEDDLFGAPAEEAVEEPADELFGEPTAEEPAADLFGEPAAEEPADDLFDEPAVEEPADDLFGAEEEPMADEDDLFAEPAAKEPVDDLFAEPTAEEPAEDDGGLFDEPAEAVEDAADDLFAPEETEPSDAEADLFDFGSILREPGGVDSVAQRTWVDNTGRFSTVGRLLAIDGGSIRLVKENGALATVPLSRLSQSDLEFVSRQSVAMHQAQEHAIARGATPADDAKQARTADELPLRTAQL